MTNVAEKTSTLSLSALSLDVRNKLALRDLASPYDLRLRLLRAFDRDGDAPDQEAGKARAGRLLFRVDSRGDSADPVVLVQSEGEPDWSRVEDLFPGYFRPGDAASKVRDDLATGLARLAVGANLRFRLRANPIANAPAKPDPTTGNRPRGKRVGLAKAEDQEEWLRRRFAAGGAELRACRVVDEGHQELPHGRSRAQLRVVLFEGILMVREPARFAELVREGVGPGKAFGMGLLSVAPAG